MAAIDDMWLQVLAAQRRLGFNLPPVDPALPGGETLARLTAERDALIARIKREGG